MVVPVDVARGAFEPFAASIALLYQHSIPRMVFEGEAAFCCFGEDRHLVLSGRKVARVVNQL
jgi:hypothetical protein